MLKQEDLDAIKSMEYLCVLEPSTINDVPVSMKDFGINVDFEYENKETDYSCGNMQFLMYDYIDTKVLEKYNITEQEYRKIQEKMKQVLSFGKCNYCD